MAVSIDQARAVKDKLVQRLATDPNIAGVGLIRAGDSWAVKVNVRRDAPRSSLPPEINGVRITIETVGRIVAR
jgi:hypothetical protein